MLLPPWAKRAIWRVCVRWPFLADLYYCLVPQFRREHHAVLLGKLLHEEDMQAADDVGAEYTLRRNIHRLEKGLIMRPRREVFAREYLGETVEVYLGLSGSNREDIRPLMCWSKDVLTTYFDAVASDPAIDPYQERFLASLKETAGEAQATEACQVEGQKRTPYARDTAPLKADYEAMLELAKRRRSVRWYLNKPVPRELIDRAIEIANLSPSACNRQPFTFRIFDKSELAQKIGSIPTGTKGFAQDFVCLIVIVGDLRAYFSERDRHAIYVDGALAAMALQFGLEVQGVSSCCINWPDIEPRERAMSKELGLASNERPIMCMSIGYPDPEGQVPYSQKKSLDEIRSYNRTC